MLREKCEMKEVRRGRKDGEWIGWEEEV